MDAAAQVLLANTAGTGDEAERWQNLLNTLQVASMLMPLPCMWGQMPMPLLLHHLCRAAELCCCRNAGWSNAQAADLKVRATLPDQKPANLQC